MKGATKVVRYEPLIMFTGMNFSSQNLFQVDKP